MSSQLGDYIDRVKEVIPYDKDIPIKGLSVEKCFVDSHIVNLENIKGKLQLVRKNQFCYKPSTARNGDKLSIALNGQLDALQISNTYVVFYIKKPDKLINHYLELWIKRSSFDKLARYLSTGGIREELSHKSFCSIPISIPPLESQERIIKKYSTLERIIRQKREINEKLERWMQSLFHIWFDSLEENQYSYKTFGELFTIIRGGRPPRGNREQEQRYFCKEGGIPWLQVGDISKKGFKFVSETSEQLTLEGAKKCRAKLIPENRVIFVRASSKDKNLGRVFTNQLKTFIDDQLWAIVAGGARIIYLLLIFIFQLKKTFENWRDYAIIPHLI